MHNQLLIVTSILLLFGAASAQAEATDETKLRLSREGFFVNNNFKTISPGISKRWLRNLSNPTFCRMTLCHGTCSDILGTPLIGAFSPEECQNDTPCGFKRSFIPLEDLNPCESGCCH
ncbi:MAG: hypothetical protein K2W82_04275 [Candidatus Obscuribacterales bacterium]|nr:hypothetical protein [Candidatus Obscuribacterales bacterium]